MSTTSAEKACILDQETLSIPHVCAMLSKRVGKPINRTTVLRWITEGVSVSKGKPSVRLRAARAGRFWLISREAFNDFVGRCTEEAMKEHAHAG